MAGPALRPGGENFLRAWGTMVESEASGAGFDFRDTRQATFQSRVEQFLAAPTGETFAALWSEDAVVAHANPGPDLLVSTFDGDVADLARFLETLRSADAFDPSWSDRLGWDWALWELYTRLDTGAPAILTEDAAAGLGELGPRVGGSFDERMATLRRFADRYTDVVGHPTGGTDHEVPVRVELEELFGLLTRLDTDAVAAQLKGPYGDVYRHLYGGREAPADRTDPVTLVDEATVVYAYAWGKANDAYGRDEQTAYWGGQHWESWKDDYVAYFDDTVRGRYDLTDLDPGDVGPLFEDVTRRDATDLSASVAEYLMGGQWGQYTWNDVEDHLVANPRAASGMLSLFFDDDVHVVDRLQAFKEHSIHVTTEEGRSPGSVERMATSLLMLASPDDHVGLPPRKTATLLADLSTLPEYKSGFRPRQYGVVVHALRDLRDEIRRALAELDGDGEVTMLDVHNVIWMYEGEGEPTAGALPPGRR